jgi:hypothetical protein
VVQNEGGLDLLRHDHNLGIFTTAYNARYVARQFVLDSLPTFLFGPSFAALRIGNSLGYVISYLVFLSAIASYLTSRGLNGLFWGSWVGMMVSLGHYPLREVRMFEQSVMPLAATMMFLAAILYFLARQTPARAVWVAWSMNYLTCGYTPAYGTWALAACILAYLAIHPLHRHRLLLPALIYGLMSLVVAGLIVRHGGELWNLIKPGSNGLSLSGWLWRYFEGFTAMFNAGVSVLPAPLGLAAIAVIWLAAKERDWRVFFILFWYCAVVLASLTMLGSWFDKPGYDVHRSMIVLPVISAAIAVFCSEHFNGQMEGRLIKSVAAFSMVYMIYTSISIPLLNRWYFFNDVVMSDFDETALRISDVAHDRRLPAIRELCVVPPLSLSPFDLGGALTYFFPEARFVQDAVPIPGPGSYTLEYNDRLRGPDYRTPSKRQLPYIVLHEAPETAAFKRMLQRIREKNGLIADYRLAEGSGSSTSDNDGNFKPALLSEGASWETSHSKPGITLSGQDSYLTLPGMPIATCEMTIATWVKWNGGSGELGLVKVGDPGAGNTYIYLSKESDRDWLRLIVDTPVPPNLAELTTIEAPLPSPGIWNLVTVVLNGEEAILWVDAVPTAKVRIVLKDPDLLRRNHNWIGHALSKGPDFSGTIGRIQVYNRALSEAEVVALANMPPP